MQYFLGILLTVIFSATTQADTIYDTRTAHTAAQVYVAECMEGSSAQGRTLGLSFNSETAQCKALRQAAAHTEEYDKVEDKTSTEAQYHKSKANRFMQLADKAVEDTHVTDVYSENANNLILTGSFILGLLLLL